jgi:CheY-like chemotaxis protein
MSRKTILIVDPDTSLRARLRSMLEVHYDVLEAQDGMEAVELAKANEPPSMIVSETAMPRVDGFTMAKILRNNPHTRRVPIMFVSTQHAPQQVTQALAMGVTQYLPKTTTASEIVDKIRKLVV